MKINNTKPTEAQMAVTEIVGEPLRSLHAAQDVPKTIVTIGQLAKVTGVSVWKLYASNQTTAA